MVTVVETDPKEIKCFIGKSETCVSPEFHKGSKRVLGITMTYIRQRVWIYICKNSSETRIF